MILYQVGDLMKKYISKYALAIVGIIFLILFETTGYFLTKLIQGPPNIIKELNIINLPLVPYFVYIYASWYLLLGIIPMHIYTKNKKVYYKYFTSALISIIILNIIFVIYPTTVPREEVLNTNLTTYLLNIIYYLDTPAVNCFPSAHCLISCLFIISLIDTKEINKQIKIFYIIISILIMLSTLFIKQHIFIDVISACIIAIITYYITDKTNLYTKIYKLIEKSY